VHDFQIIAGRVTKCDFGNGQCRGFAPLDGGARRALLMFAKERARGTSADVLLEQLSRAPLYSRDDPERAARWGSLPERSD
jgi:hypothetical protein